MDNKVAKVKSFWNEEWAKVETRIPTNLVNYYISNHGRLKSVMKKNGAERLLKPTKMRDGYIRANMKVKGPKMEVYTIHRLVYEYFVGHEEEGEYFIIHKDENKDNNHVKNLQLMNRAQLSKRWDDKGFYKDVDIAAKPNVKLTETKVRLLRQRLKKGKTKKSILAKQFNISLAQLRKIELGISWKNVKI